MRLVLYLAFGAVAFAQAPNRHADAEAYSAGGGEVSRPLPFDSLPGELPDARFQFLDPPRQVFD